MIALIVTLFLAPLGARDFTVPVVDYADVTLRYQNGSIVVTRVTRGHFAKPTSLRRYLGRFEARAVEQASLPVPATTTMPAPAAKATPAKGAPATASAPNPGPPAREFVRFDFPLLAPAEAPDDVTTEAHELGKRIRSGVSATTTVRVPLPPGADAVAIWDTQVRRVAVSAPLPPSD